MKATAKLIQGSAQARLKKLEERVTTLPQLWERVLKKSYTDYQKQRWVSSNWGGWKPLEPNYDMWKRTHATIKSDGKTYPIKRGGASTMVLTGRLAESVSLESRDYSRVAVMDRVIEVYTTVPYAPFADKERTFTKYSKEFKAKLKKKIGSYLKGVGK